MLPIFYQIGFELPFSFAIGPKNLVAALWHLIVLFPLIAANGSGTFSQQLKSNFFYQKFTNSYFSERKFY